MTKDKKIIKPIGDVVFSEIHLPIESYILCFSYANDDGLYEEFEGSDACLIIHDMNEFTKRIHIAFNKEMPNHIGRNGRVNYGRQLSPFGVLFTKPLDYIYQREYRFSWIPEQPKQFIDLNHIMDKNQEKIRKIIPKPIVITLGSIKDISSIKMKP